MWIRMHTWTKVMRKLLKLTYIYGAHMNKSHAHIFYDRSNHTDYIGAKTLKHQSSSMTGSSNTILLPLLLSLAVSTEWHLRCCEVVTEWLEWQGSSVGWSTCLDLMSARVPSEFRSISFQFHSSKSWRTNQGELNDQESSVNRKFNWTSYADVVPLHHFACSCRWSHWIFKD
jgi:hypothetical protein